MSDLHRPTTYKSLKELRKGAKKAPPVPPPPPPGMSYSSAGGYGEYGTRDGGYGSPAPPPPPHHQPQGAQQQQRKGWSGSVQNKMRAEPDTYETDPYGYDRPASNYSQHSQSSIPPVGGSGPSRWGRSSSAAESDIPPPANSGSASGSGSGSSRWGFGKSSHSNSNATIPPVGAPGAHGAPPTEQKRGWFGRHEPEPPRTASPAGSTSSGTDRHGPGHGLGHERHDKGPGRQQHASRDPVTGRYIPPSERGQVVRASRDPVTGRYIPPSEREPVEEAGKPAQSWGAWASEGINSAWTSTSTGAATAWQSTSKAAQEGWDSVNDASKRDKALSSVGSGAAKAAGGAIKYTGKGIWAVGKAAVK